jgi:hypothetical protein
MREQLERILARHGEKPVVSLCKKCLKKLSFKSGADAANLSDLCFWLFVFGDSEAVFALASVTHALLFDRNFTVWDEIHNIWALEVYLFRKRGDAEAAGERKNAILHNLRLPNQGETQEAHDRFRTKRYNRINYEEWTYKLDVEKAVAAGDKTHANSWRLSALKRMIGWGETGLYPDFAAHDEQRETEIVQYADILAGRTEPPRSAEDSAMVAVKKLPKKFRDACTLILADREAGTNALSAPVFDALARQRDAVFAELAYFDGDFEKALALDKALCPWWGEWHYGNVRTEHVAAMTFAAFRLGRETELAAFFKEQIERERARTDENDHILASAIRFYEAQIERLAASYDAAVSSVDGSGLLRQRIKDGTPEDLKAYAKSGLWRVASDTQVRPMDLLGEAWLWPVLTDKVLREIAAASVPPQKE